MKRNCSRVRDGPKRAGPGHTALSCPFCAGVVAIDDAALRRSLVVCSHCGTILRVGADGLEQLSNASALSGDVDLRQIVLAGAGAISLDVVARHSPRGEICLADRIQDPREARLILSRLERILAKAR